MSGLGKLFVQYKNKEAMEKLPKRYKVGFDVSYNVYAWFKDTSFDQKIERALHERATRYTTSISSHDLKFELSQEKLERVLEKLKRFARKEKETFMVEIHPKER